MARYKKIQVVKMGKDGKIIMFERKIKRNFPTLKQYAIRKYFGSLSSATKGLKGVVRTRTGLMPKSSNLMRGNLKLTADDLINDELIKEYNYMYGELIEKEKKVKKGRRSRR